MPADARARWQARRRCPARRGAALNWRQTLGPFNADVQVNNGLWSRGAALDFEFDTTSALYYDVPSLDTVGVAVTVE